MSETLRVLVISREPWRDDSNEGSVFTSLFENQPFTIANICCKPGLPDNNICTTYFQLTDRMAFNNVVRGEPIGRTFLSGGENNAVCNAEPERKAFYDFFRRHQWEIFFAARQMLWKLADFRNEALTGFVRRFGPDVIFAPLCYDQNVLAIQRYVIDLAGCPAVTYLYDDIYSLKQVRFSPLYWIDRFALRRDLRKTLAKYAYSYTMTEEQADAFERLLGCKLSVLRKCVPLPASVPPRGEHKKPVRFIYAGGIYYGRDEVLIRIAEALQRCGGRLDIYTNSPLSHRAACALNNGRSSFVHAAVPFSDLRARYAESDVAVHVESFRPKPRQITRLSFSSKIADCLSSGCAVLAVCAGCNTGLQYLRRMDAAVCVDTMRGVDDAVRMLVDSPALIDEYAGKALRCAAENHDPEKTRLRLRRDLFTLAETRMSPEAVVFDAAHFDALPLISVVLPVYKVENYIGKCMDNLLKQTYSKLEIILVDDGSPDRCPEICDEYAARDPRVRVIHKQNEGVSVARNVGVAAATGPLIAFVDSDDYTTTDMIEQLYRTMISRNAQLSVCGMCEVKPGETPPPPRRGSIDTLSAEQALETMLYQKLFYTSPWAKLMTAEIARAHPFPPFQRYEDMATTYLWLADAKVVAVDTTVKYYYVQHVGSFMGRAFSDERFVQLDTSQTVYEFIEKHYPSILPAARARRFAVFCQVLLQMPKNSTEYTERRRQMLETMRSDARLVARDRNCRRKDHFGAVIFRHSGETGLRLMWRFTLR